jgi:acylphosphatase
MMCKKITISGKVQGVGFRISAIDKAKKLGLKGYVKNTHSEDVEIVICGDETAVQEFAEWSQEGPKLAKVDHIHIEELKPKIFKDFEIK